MAVFFADWVWQYEAILLRYIKFQSAVSWPMYKAQDSTDHPVFRFLLFWNSISFNINWVHVKMIAQIVFGLVGLMNLPLWLSTVEESSYYWVFKEVWIKISCFFVIMDVAIKREERRYNIDSAKSKICSYFNKRNFCASWPTNSIQVLKIVGQ